MNAFGRKWIVEVVKDVLDLPEVVDLVPSEHFFNALIGINSVCRGKTAL